MKLLIKIGIVFGIVIFAVAGFLFFQVRSLSVEQITDDVFVLYGMGGNVGVLKTDVGAVVVDSMTFQLQGEQIVEKAKSLTGMPVVLLINTHYHTDHTHGNPAFDSGTRVVATDRTLHHMLETDSDYFSGPAKALLPNETFSQFKPIEIGNKTIHLYQTGRGHTDGDLVVLFVEDKVLHAGDLFFNKHYPNIDLEGGGSVQDWSDTLEPILALDYDQIIAGHGPVAGKSDLQQFQRFMDQLATVGKEAANLGWTKEQTQKSEQFTEDAEYTEISMIVPLGLDREFVLGRAWEEATENFTKRP